MVFFLRNLSLGILLIILSCQSPDSQALDPSPNILLIIADDLGYTDLGCYGSEIRTPNLDLLAKEGLRFTSFYTAATCSPTRGMLYSGVDNHRCGYGTMEGDWAPNQKGVRGYEGHLNYDVVAFPKLLQDHGYHTSIAGKWHQAFPASNQDLWPGKRGFDRQFCLLQGGAGHFEDMQKLLPFFDRSLYINDGQLLDSLPNGFYSSRHYTDQVISYIEESQEQGKPFFSTLSYTAPHWPLQVPDTYIDLYKGRYDTGYEALAQERFAKAQALGVLPAQAEAPPLPPNVMPWDSLSPEEQAISARTMEVYAAMVERMDANAGRLIAHLKASGLYENTLIVFMADNGAEGNWVPGIGKGMESWIVENFDNRLENIGRKNSYVFTGPAWAQVSTLPFQWYKGFATEGGVRCPAIMHYPKAQQAPGSLYEGIVSVKDLAPTFLDLAGTQHPGETYQGRTVFPIDGASMKDWLMGNQEWIHEAEKAHCWELYGRRGVRKGIWKAEWQDAPYGENAWELYNLNEDLAELHNLADSHPEKMAELIQDWEAYAKMYKVVLPNEKVAYGTEQVWRK